MKWIDVNDDLPPSNARVLVNAYLCHDSEHLIIVDAFWEPSKGWLSWGHKTHLDRVLHWHPLCEAPPCSEIKRHSLEQSQAVCEIPGDILKSPLSCDPEDSS